MRVNESRKERLQGKRRENVARLKEETQELGARLSEELEKFSCVGTNPKKLLAQNKEGVHDKRYRAAAIIT